MGFSNSKYTLTDSVSAPKHTCTAKSWRGRTPLQPAGPRPTSPGGPLAQIRAGLRRLPTLECPVARLGLFGKRNLALSFPPPPPQAFTPSTRPPASTPTHTPQTFGTPRSFSSCAL